MLEPKGYEILRPATAPEALELARSATPDVVVLAGHAPGGGDAAEFCRQLRRDGLTPPRVPVLILSGTPTLRAERVAGLRAGAWDVLAFPFDTEEMLLRLDAYLAAKLDADAARDQGLLDRETELYGARGVKRRAGELIAEATRRHGALACVVLGADPPSAPAAALRHVAGVLHTHGRQSDVIGRWNNTEFAVLAPETDDPGAATLAQRLMRVIEATPAPAGIPRSRLAVRAGYAAVGDVAAAPLEAQGLLTHASSALAVARTPQHAPIQRYTPGARAAPP